MTIVTSCFSQSLGNCSTKKSSEFIIYTEMRTVYLPTNWQFCRSSKGKKEMFYLTTHSTHFILAINADQWPAIRVCVCVWGGGELNYLRAHIHLRFRHAHRQTKCWLPSLGSRGGRGKRVLFRLILKQHKWRIKNPSQKLKKSVSNLDVLPK